MGDLNKRLLGSFSLENLICTLYETDLNPLASSAPPADAPLGRGQSAMESFLRFTEQTYGALSWEKGRSVDFVPQEPLPDDLHPDVRRTLFHERAHYWQLISCSMLQYRFCFLLDRLAMGAGNLGGHERAICGEFLDPSAMNVSVAQRLERIEANINKISASSTRVLKSNIVSEDPLTDMPLLQFSIGSGPPYGYGARLGFGDGKEEVLVPFSGPNLLESATTIFESLWAGASLPDPDQLESDEEQLYLGAWVFWRRLHDGRYESEEDLALSFVAAVDLCMNPDVLTSAFFDEEHRYEILAIPYRFGKLAFTTRALPILSTEDQDKRQAIHDWQTMLAKHSGWTTPEATAWKFSRFLTFRLLRSLAPLIDESRIDEEQLQRVFSDIEDEVSDEKKEDLEDIFQLLSNAHAAKYGQQGFGWPLGQATIGAMLNAALFRLQNPGSFALMHADESRIAGAFPLPLVMIDGTYCFDHDSFVSDSSGLPYPVTRLEVVLDAIGLITLNPLRHDRGVCGFVEREEMCVNTARGEDCPLRALKDGREIPKTWCHWTSKALFLNTAPPEIKSAWPGNMH